MRRGLAILALATACSAPPGGPDDAGAAPVAPRRVVSQTVLSDAILHDLGPSARDKVVGLSTMADDARYSVPRWTNSEIPRIGGSAERLLAAEPDFVILASYTSEETKAMLGRAHVPFLEIDGFDRFEDYRVHVRAIAGVLDTADAGEALVAKFDARLAELDRTRAPKPWPTVVSWDEGAVPGAHTSFDEATTHAGLVNLPAREGLEGHHRVGLARLITWDPDYVVVACDPNACGTAAENFGRRPGTAAMRATRQGHVIAVSTAILLSTGSEQLDLVAALQEASR